MILIDATGNSFGAKVDEEHRLWVKANMVTMERHVAQTEHQAYTMDIDSVVVDGDGYYILNLQNSHDHDLVITSITLWTASSKDDCNVEAMVGTSLASAGTTTITPTNVDSRSGLVAEGTFYVNDGSGNMTVATAGLICGRHRFSTTPVKWVKTSGWIIAKNKCFSLLCSKDNTFRGYLSFYYHNE